jgi:hypothetical protein
VWTPCNAFLQGTIDVYLILTNLWGVIIGALVCFVAAFELLCCKCCKDKDEEKMFGGWTGLWYASDGIMSFATKTKADEDGLTLSST